MQQHTAAPLESASHASRTFFGDRAAPESAFFAPMIQAKCAACESEERIQRQPEPEELPQVQAKCAACEHEPPKLQAKLSLGMPGDRFEQEADQVADTVMRAPDPQAIGNLSAAQPLRIQRESSDTCSVSDEEKAADEVDEELEDVEPADAKETPVSLKRSGGDTTLPADMERRLDSSRGGGDPLSATTRDFMESRFGYDFSGVRIHTGASAQHMNRDVRSLAFTSGQDVYFGTGQYRPDTDAGKHLLAHELTHVVQQSGGGASGVVREKSDPNTLAPSREIKPYYFGSGWTSGTATHNVIEKLLREQDDQLVTEASIPGANRFVADLNLIGVADVYKSVPKKTVSGVKAFENKVKDEADKDKPKTYRFVNMNSIESRGTSPADVKAAPSLTDKKKGSRNWVGDFPEKVMIGEIKPFNAGKLAAGLHQLDMYARGYQDFVKLANATNGGQTRASIAVERLTLNIPPFLDFDHWAVQQKLPSPKSTSGNKRLWVASAGNGVYLYTMLSSALDTTPPQAWNDHLAELRKKVLAPLTEPAKRTDLMKPIAPKLAVSSLGQRAGSSRRVQRDTSARGATYWGDRKRDWLTAQGEWSSRFRKASVTSLKPQRDKVRFEKALGRQGSSLKASQQQEVREDRSLMFWSSAAGRMLGRVRFMLGSAWDKALAVFEKMKEKMTGVRAKLAGMNPSGTVKVGWAKQLIEAIVVVCKRVFTSFITESFNFFADCFHSAMDKVIAKFEAELNKRYAEEICKARKLFEDSKQELEAKWGDVIRQVEAVVAAIQDVKYWVDVATTSITLIRVGVQAVSCLTPPALGCLWGLVAQLGIGTMVGLVIGTQWFNDNIITPNVRRLVREYVSPTYRKFINDALGEGLKEYHCDVKDAAPAELNFQATGGLADGSPELRGKRDQWEQDNEAEILKDLGQVFEKKGGKKASKQELLQLAAKIRDSKLTPEQIKEMIEQTRNPVSGKLNVEEAQQNAARDDVLPPAPAKVRAIDYEKAREQNVVFRKMRGWDPVTFIKKPGIEVDTHEFADAVYDMQVGLRIHADGILGDDTVVAFYDRNKKKPDIFYEEATRAIEERKAAREKAAAEKAAAEKAAAEKAAADKATKEGEGKGAKPVDPSLGPDVKVLSASAVKATSKSDVIPRNAHLRLFVVGVRSYVTSDNGEDVVKPVPATIQLDIYADKKHLYRLTDVAVSRLYISKVYGEGFCARTLWLEMSDGFTVELPAGSVTLHRTDWCWSDS